MQDKDKQISPSQKMLLSVPVEIDRKYREEAKKREITISEMLVKLIEERDYFEKKILEKERIIENSTEKISKDIIESLSEIRRTNLELRIVSSSLTSIPQVTEEARKINERCTKSSEIIQNFNVVLENINKEIKNAEDSIKAYNKIIQANKTEISSMNEDINSIKINFNAFVNSFTKGFYDKEISSMIKIFNSEVKNSIQNMVDFQSKKILSLSDLFKRKLIVALCAFVLVTTILSMLFLYNIYTTTSSNADKIAVFNQFKQALCSKENAKLNVNYKEICK